MHAKTRLRLSIDGNEDVMDHVVSVEYAESIDALDALQVHLSLETHGDSSDIVDLLKPGAAYKVELKDEDAVTHTGVGDIVEVAHRRSAGGRYTIDLVGLDGLHRLNYGAPEAQLWEASHDQIASDIASRHGLSAEADGVSTTAGLVLQHDVSDALFLLQLARKHNYFVRVVDKKLLFSSRGGKEKLEVDWKDGVLEMRLRASLSGIVTKVTVHGRDYVQDEVVTHVATDTDLVNISGGETGVSLAAGAFKEIDLVVNQSGITQATEAEARAVSEIKRRAERFVTGTLLVEGMPSATSGKTLTVVNGPWPLIGTFLVRQTRHLHEVGTGYRTYIDFCSDSLPRKEE